MSDATRPVRLTILHWGLPKYRVPVFRELARRPGIELKVLYGEFHNLPNVAPDGFDGRQVPLHIGQVMNKPVYWFPAQWDLAASKEIDALCVTWDLHYASLVPALIRAKKNGVPTILWGHGYSKQDAGWRKALRNKVTDLATAVVFYNHTAAERFIAGGGDRRKVFVAINSLDQTEIQAARQWWLDRPEELARFKREKGLDSGPVVLFVSRLEPLNRLEMLLEAAPRLAERFAGLKVAIVGTGPDEAHLRDVARRVDPEGKICVFAGAIYDQMQLAPWFLSAEAFCYPTNIGLSLLHSFGYGVPVITSDRIEGQNPEIEALRDGENGLLYAEGDVEAMARTIGRVIEDKDLRQRMGEAARRTALDEFSIEKMADGLEAAARYCAGQKKSQPQMGHR